MRKLILLILIIMSQNFVFSQEEENSTTIIFNDNVTMKGYGEIKKNKIYFKLTPNEKPSEWDYDSVKGVIFSGYGYSEKYEYVLPEKSSKPVLMQVMEEGNVNLYKYSKLILNAGNFSSDIRNTGYHYDVSSIFYVKRETENEATDLSSNFKAKSLKYFADCEIIITKLNRRDFNDDKILEMVTYYNNYCDGEEN